MLQNICRICAKDTENVSAINLFEESHDKFLCQIHLITGVLLQAKPNFPDFLCENCLSDLKCAIDFRKRCLSNQKQWEQAEGAAENFSTRRSKRRKRHCNSYNEDDEVLIKVETDFSVEDNNVQLLDPVGINVEFDKEETVYKEISDSDTEWSGSKKKKTVLESSVKKEPNRNCDTDEIESDTDVELPNFEEGRTELLQTAKKNRKQRRHSEEETSCDTEWSGSKEQEQKKINSEATQTGKKLRVKQILPVFFCDQCGTNITGKSSFERHLRKHANLRPYQCDACSACFLSTGELKAHQVTHTGVRKFPCRYCDRTYVNYSGRLRHERTHTNDRPFMCSQCGKTFTNSYILKNHMLVHTGERLFRCNLCERSFSRPTHLTTHYRSNTHKQNVAKSTSQQVDETKPESLLPTNITTTSQSTNQTTESFI